MRHHDKRPHENKRLFFIYRLENHASLSYPFQPKWFVHPTCNITSKAKSYSIINDSNFESLFYFSGSLTKKWKMIKIESRFALKSGRQCGNTLDKCAAWNIHEFSKTFILSLFYPSIFSSPSPFLLFLLSPSCPKKIYRYLEQLLFLKACTTSCFINKNKKKAYEMFSKNVEICLNICELIFTI